MKSKLLLLLSLALAVPVLIVPTGCTSTPSSRTQQVSTLKIVGASAKAGIDSAALMLKSGQITVEQYQKVADIYDNKFQPAFNLAVQAVGSDLSLASPELMTLAAQIAALVAQFTPVK